MGGENFLHAFLYGEKFQTVKNLQIYQKKSKYFKAWKKLFLCSVYNFLDRCTTPQIRRHNYINYKGKEREGYSPAKHQIIIILLHDIFT